eukprot:GHVP01048483.1.p1 GENE.GHVP01048483.1~~GHVP01048483.1.p1  ORF type:complete len:751 (+),score=133.36 GHVP01048483.1:42-2294(+)
MMGERSTAYFAPGNSGANEDGISSSAVLSVAQFRTVFKGFVNDYTTSTIKDQLRNSHSLSSKHKNIKLQLEYLQRIGFNVEEESQIEDDMLSVDLGKEGFSVGLSLLNCFSHHPLKYIGVAEEVLKEEFEKMFPETAGASGISNLTFQLEIESTSRPMKIRDLKAHEIENLVVVPCVVVQASKPQHKALNMKIRCRDCQSEKTLKLPPWRQGVPMPRVCDAVKGSEDSKCSLDPFIILSDESDYCDVQFLKVQEMHEDVPSGDMPRHVAVTLSGSLCSKVIPGDRLYVVGVFSSYEKHNEQNKAENVRNSYIHSLGLRHADDFEHLSRKTVKAWSIETEEAFRQIAAASDPYEVIAQSIAPSIYGFQDIKKSIACLLFGGTHKKHSDGTRVRGDINILLLGDPSTAKSQLLKFVQQCAGVSVYTSGKGSSAAGLTAAIMRDSQGNFCLEGGAMVLADGGVVCVDEFDKMRDDDRVAMHEAMEQQTISIAKAGITTMLKTQCSVLAAANPSFGSYDDSRDTEGQHDFETTILSRFDLIWLIRDERSEERDRQIASHILSVQTGQGEKTQSGPVPFDLLRSYLFHVRSTCHPKLTSEALRRLENYYVEVRDAAREGKGKKKDQIPITVRQLESMVRLSEARAKMFLRRDVLTEDVEEATRLFKLSTVEASKSTLARETLTPAETNLVKTAESAILQRLPVGGKTSKATVMKELKQRGFEPMYVGKALRVLAQKGIIEERGDANIRRVGVAVS